MRLRPFDLLRRGARLPDDVRQALALAPGERVISAGRDSTDGWVVATDLALHAPGRRMAWTDVVHAQWLPDDETLAVEPLPGTVPTWRLSLREPGRLPETVRERVMASIVMSRRVSLPGGGARLVARRTGSGETGELLWQVVPDPGTDLTDPLVRADVETQLATMRAELS